MELHLVLSGFAIKPHISQCILSKTILKSPQKLHFSIVFHIFVQNLACVLFQPFGISKMVLSKGDTCSESAKRFQMQSKKCNTGRRQPVIFCHCTNWNELPKEVSASVAWVSSTARCAEASSCCWSTGCLIPWTPCPIALLLWLQQDGREGFTEEKHGYKTKLYN